MSRLSHDEYFLEMLKLVSARGTCGRRQVGAIIVDEEHHVLSTGYNGPPKGLTHCITLPCTGRNDKPGDTTNCIAVHAEQNALLQCSRLDRAFKIYVSCAPCFVCAKMLANTSIKHVVSMENYADARGAAILKAANIKYWHASRR